MTPSRELRRVESPDDVRRRVLFAVELVDPVTLEVRYEDLAVEADGLTQPPSINRSGRFVWLREGNRWPGAITVKPDRRLGFAPHVAAAPPRPPDLDAATPTQRLVRITLRPTGAYAFEAGVTAVRGRLREDGGATAPPVEGALVQLAWQDADTGAWFPPPPPPPAPPGPGGFTPSPREPETDVNGQFAAFLRLPRAGNAEPDLEDGLLKVRLQLTRGRFMRVTRVTPPDFEFVPSTNPAARGRVREGQLLARDLKLGWSELSPI
jgi:hypothetical protein